MNAKERALDEAAKSSDPKLRKWADDQREKLAKGNPPELPERPPGEAPASPAVASEVQIVREGALGNCEDCKKPIDKRKDWQPFHKGEIIIHTCLACANIRWKAINSFK